MEKRHEDEKQLFEQAQLSFQNNEYEDALKNISAAIRINNTNGTYLYVRAGIYLCLNKYEEAITDLTNSLKCDIKSHEDKLHRLKLRAISYGMMENYNKALEDWNTIINDGGG